MICREKKAPRSRTRILRAHRLEPVLHLISILNFRIIRSFIVLAKPQTSTWICVQIYHIYIYIVWHSNPYKQLLRQHLRSQTREWEISSFKFRECVHPLAQHCRTSHVCVSIPKIGLIRAQMARAGPPESTQTSCHISSHIIKINFRMNVWISFANFVC